MTLDDIEQKAREALESFPAQQYASPADARRAAAAIRADREPELARALLAMLPVVRAAEAWNDDPDGRLKTDTDVELQDALDTLNTALSADGRMGEGR